MANYTNLGFTEKEAELIDTLISGWQVEGGPHSLAHSYILTEAGTPVNRELDYIEPWDGSFYLSVLERSGPFTAVLDTGHGRLFLIDTAAGVVHHSNGNACATDKAVMLDAEYYGVANWLYINELASKENSCES